MKSIKELLNKCIYSYSVKLQILCLWHQYWQVNTLKHQVSLSLWCSDCSPAATLAVPRHEQKVGQSRLLEKAEQTKLKATELQQYTRHLLAPFPVCRGGPGRRHEGGRHLGCDAREHTIAPQQTNVLWAYSTQDKNALQEAGCRVVTQQSTRSRLWFALSIWSLDCGWYPEERPNDLRLQTWDVNWGPQ